MWKKIFVGMLLSLIGFWIFVAIFGEIISIGSTSNLDQMPRSNGIKVSRPYYPLRHWKWSGIPPFYGEFITDPHFLGDIAFEIPKTVREFLGAYQGRYQLLDINPFFRDSSTEHVLVLELDDTIIQAPIDLPSESKINAFSPSEEFSIVVVEQKVALVFDYYGRNSIAESLGVGVLEGDLLKNPILRFHPISSAEGMRLMNEIAADMLTEKQKTKLCHKINVAGERSASEFKVNLCQE